MRFLLLLDRQGLLAHKAHKEMLELQVQLAHREHKVLLDLQAHKASKEHKVFKGMLAQQELPVLLELLDQLEPMERLLQ